MNTLTVAEIDTLGVVSAYSGQNQSALLGKMNVKSNRGRQYRRTILRRMVSQGLITCHGDGRGMYYAITEKGCYTLTLNS